MAAFKAVIEQINPLFAHHALHLGIVGEKNLDVDAISHVRPINELISLRE